MVRSFSNAKVLSALISNFINRRGLSTAASSQGVVSGFAQRGAAPRSGGMVKKTGEETVRSNDKVSWEPDPRTGFYRPNNVAEEIDAAELRAALLKKH